MARSRDERDEDLEARAGAPGEPEESEVDPDRLLRQRIVFGFVTGLVGAFALLVSSVTMGIVFSGRVSWPVSFAALLLTVSSALLILRGGLRAGMSLRPDDDELRSLAGFVSLACGVLLLVACADLLFLTFSVVLAAGGSTALFLLPLGVTAYLTLGFTKEATADFTKKVFPRREVRLFLLSILYFSLSILVASLLFAASAAAPITLNSPANGATICSGTVVDFEVTDPAVSNVSWSAGNGSFALAAPYDLNTSGWPDGPVSLTLTAQASSGASANQSFQFTISSSRPPCA